MMTHPVHSEQSQALGETLPVTDAATDATNLETAAQNRYVIGNEIAQGGIGRILSATDERLKRTVALKELLDPSPEYEARFLREALITAKLQHPAIVPVYDVGRLPNGEIFYAMKLVSGRSLGDVVADAKTLDKRLALLPHVIAVAEAIAYAHSEKIVHRDLKPANVLIGPFGETVVIDWGIAKDLREIESEISTARSSLVDEPAPDSSSSLTMAGAILGTPGYMPPEQAAGEAVDEKADVYALGAILYHVLAGVAPFEGVSGLEVLAKVLAEDPPPLSTKERGVPPDLLAVVNKAMARDRSQRYPTANEFAHDLRQFQTGQIVGAYNYSRRERAIRFAQKHRAVLATTALGLAITCVIAFVSLSRVFDARRIAETERDRANEERNRAEQKQSEAEAARTKTIQQSDELILLQARAAARHDPNEALAWLQNLSGTFSRWGEARIIAADADAYGIAKVLRGHKGPLNTATYSKDGKIIATAGDDRTIILWNAEGKLLRQLVGHTDEAWRVVFTNDGKRVVSSSKDGTMRIWDVESGAQLKVIQTAGPEAFWLESIDGDNKFAILSCTSKHIELHDFSTDSVEILPDTVDCPGTFKFSNDRRFMGYAANGNARLLDLQTRKVREFKPTAGRCQFVILSDDAEHIACAQGTHTLLWNVKTGKQQDFEAPQPHPGSAGLQFSPNGKLFAHSNESTLFVLDLETGATRVFHDHTGAIFTIWFSPDSRLIATTSVDRTTVLRDLTNDTHRAHFGFRDTTAWVSFAPNIENMLVASWDHTARIFPIGALHDRIIVRGFTPMVAGRIKPGSKMVRSVQENGTVRLDSIQSDNAPSSSHSFPGDAHALSANGDSIAFAEKSGLIHVRSLENKTAKGIELRGHSGRVRRIAFSADEKRLLSIGVDNTVYVWDLNTGAGRSLFTPDGRTTTAVFSHDATQIAVASESGIVRHFSTSATAERTFKGHIGSVDALTFSPDGKFLVTGGKDHTIRIWDLATGDARVIEASGIGIEHVLVSHDGKTLYSLGGEAVIRRWDVKSGNALPILRGHKALLSRLALAADNFRLASASTDGMIRLWDLDTGQSRTLEGHRAPIAWMDFSANGEELVSVSRDGNVRVWHDKLPFDEKDLRKWMADVVPEKIDTSHLEQ